MLATARCAALVGIDAHAVHLEVDLARQGLPAFAMVGLVEGAVREAKERVFAALKNSGYRLPPARITVNLAPADLRKAGSQYDLPLALALLAAAEVIPADCLEGWFLAGELSLTGELKPIAGVLPLAIRARAQQSRGLVVPRGNDAEAAVVEGLDVFGLPTLGAVVDFLTGNAHMEPTRCDLSALWEARERHHLDYSEVKGQEHAKRAIEVAAAGAHNLLFVGPPGSGKTMLAQRLPSVLPPLGFDEALEVTTVYSVAGQLPREAPLLVARPFRSPHHTISDAGLIGGGMHPKPGEVSLAHRGVLFLDELPEFKKHVLEVLRQPLEDGRVTISRAAASLAYPADFMLIAAMNPCPCGYLGDARHPCHCSDKAVALYRARLSGPLLDRIDLHVEVPAVDYKDLRQDASPVDSATMRARIVRAREIQARRYAQDNDAGNGPATLTNSQLSGRLLAEYCRLDDAGHAFLEKAVRRLGLSARAHTRILRIARTIADLEGAEEPELTVGHLAEAITYRGMDRTTG